MNQLRQAVEELETALKRLEDSVEGLSDPYSRSRAIHAEAEALRRDRAKLAEDLDASRARERELEALADEASRALGIAIAEVKAAMNAPETTS
tara:strand:+ start:394 stop:672 length:279 start_codon:yes stop_codon:yes gene_type:complete